MVDRLSEPDQQVKNVSVVVDDSTRRHKRIKGRLCLRIERWHHIAHNTWCENLLHPKEGGEEEAIEIGGQTRDILQLRREFEPASEVCQLESLALEDQ